MTDRLLRSLLARIACAFPITLLLIWLGFDPTIAGLTGGAIVAILANFFLSIRNPKDPPT